MEDKDLKIKKQWNVEEEYWFIRWIYIRRKLRISEEENASLKAIIATSKEKSLIHKQQAEIHRLEDMLALLRQTFIPINNTNRKKKK